MARTRVSKTVTVGDLKFKPLAGRERSTSAGVERYWQARSYVGVFDGKPKRETVWRGWARADQLAAVAAGLGVSSPEPEAPPEAPRRIGVSTLDDLQSGDVALLIRAWRGARTEDPDYSEFTRKNDRTLGRRLERLIGGLLLADVDNRTGTTLRRELRATYSLATTRATLSAFLAVWRWALKEGITNRHVDFSEEYRRLRETEKRGENTGARVKTTPEAAQAWAIADALESGAPRWAWCAYQLLLMTGGRIGEIAALTWGQLGAETVTLIGKTGPREAYVDANALSRIRAERPADATDDDRVLPVTPGTARKHLGMYIERACATAKVPRITPHALRRFAVQRYIRRGVAPSVAAEQLGHTPEVMLKHYAKAQPSDKRDAAQRAGLGRRPEQAGRGAKVIPLRRTAPDEER